MALNGTMGLGFLFTAQDAASGVMGQVKKSFSEVEGAADGFGASMKNSFKAFGTGLAVMGAGIAGLAILEPAIAEFTDMSKAIALVATEADLSVFPQEKMYDVTERLASTYGKMPVDEAKALYKAVALGADDAAKSTAFLNGVNLLSVAGNADLELSANALGGALNAYQAPFSQATDYSDALFVAMTKGNTTVQDLAGSIGRVTSSAANLGIPFDEIVGAVSVMTNKGVQASEAVSGLKEALANVVHPSADAQKEAGRLGIKFTQAELRAKGLQGFLKEITTSTRFTSESFSKLFTSVEGANAVVQVASGKMGQYNTVLDAMKHKTGATQKGFDIMSETLDFQKQKFEANKKVMLGQIGAVLEPMTAGVLKFANKFLEAFMMIPKPALGFMVKLFSGFSTLLVVVWGLVAAKSAIAIFTAGIAAAGITVGSLLSVLAPVILAVGAVALAFYGLREAYDRNLGGFGDLIDGVVAKVRLGLQALGQLFGDGGFSGDVLEAFGKAENQGIKQFAINVFLWVNRIKNFFSGIAEGFFNGVEQAKPAIQSFMAALERLGAVFGFVAENGGAAANGDMWATFGAIGARVGTFLASTFEIVVNVLTDVVDAARGFMDGLKEMSPVLSMLKASFASLFASLGNIASQLHFVSTATGENQNSWTSLGNVVASVIGVAGVIFSGFVTIVQGGVALVSGAIGIVTSVFGSLSDVITGVIFVIGGLMMGKWGDIWTGMKLIVFGVVDAIIGAVTELFGAIAGIGDAVLGAMGKTSNMQGAIQDFKKFAHNEVGAGMGVLDVSGKQQVTYGYSPAASPTNAGTSPTPGFGGTPALAAAGQSVGSSGMEDMKTMTSHLATIANASKVPPVINVSISSDLSTTVTSNKGNARSHTPAPIPT